ncbi:unnamed protein product, partial [Ectocarpus sp. 12 AP-2014]
GRDEHLLKSPKQIARFRRVCMHTHIKNVPTSYRWRPMHASVGCFFATRRLLSTVVVTFLCDCSRLTTLHYMRFHVRSTTKSARVWQLFLKVGHIFGGNAVVYGGSNVFGGGRCTFFLLLSIFEILPN